MKLFAYLALAFMSFAHAEALSVFNMGPQDSPPVELNSQQMQTTQGSGFACIMGLYDCNANGRGPIIICQPRTSGCKKTIDPIINGKNLSRPQTA